MRMSHIYQPVMIKLLLENKGTATKRAIARALLMEDRSQIEYYEQITTQMVGRILTKNRKITDRDGDTYTLKNFSNLESDEAAQLIKLCQTKIDHYLEKRGEAVWTHRRKSTGYISGSIRHKVLVQAKYRCLACGISAEQKALEVDHIIPRNHGGSDDISNLQALCYSCNAAKRDQDATDLREVATSYQERSAKCLFCNDVHPRITHENELCFAIKDQFPVTQGHTLVIPKRHVEDYFDLYLPEHNAIYRLTSEIKHSLECDDPTISGFNVGVNCGESAGQTIFHCHIHLIPRRNGDTESPRGGVRGVIPGKQAY